MRVVIVGATGNAGTALLRRLRSEPDIDIVGVARRLPPPEEPYDRVDWRSCDVGGPGAAGKLAEVFTGADAVVHLAGRSSPATTPAGCTGRTFWAVGR